MGQVFLLGCWLGVSLLPVSLGVSLPVSRHFSQWVFLLGQIFLSGCWFSLWVLVSLLTANFLNKSPLWGQVFLLDVRFPIWVLVFLLGVDFWIPVWVSVFLLGRRYVDEISSWGKSSPWVLDFLFGCPSSCWEDIFLMRLLSGASLHFGFLISCLGVRLPVGKSFS